MREKIVIAMPDTIQKLTCIHCKRSISGNENKKFCDDRCKNAFHNRRRKEESAEIGSIINTLKVNRRVLVELLNERDVKKVSAQRLLDKGFNFRYYTHQRVNKGNGRGYFFCFDYGYTLLPSGWYMIVRGFRETD